MHIRSTRSRLRLVCNAFAAVIFLALINAETPAAAADFSIGAGGGAARGQVDCVDAFSCDRSSSFWKIFAGLRLSEGFELQALAFGASRLAGGDTTTAGAPFGGSFKVDGIGLTGGYRWALAPAWSIVGRAGIAGVHTRFEYADGRFGDVSKTSLQPLLGLGIAWQLTPAIGVGLDYDFTRFKAHDADGALHMLGVAAQYSF